MHHLLQQIIYLFKLIHNNNKNINKQRTLQSYNNVYSRSDMYRDQIGTFDWSDGFRSHELHFKSTLDTYHAYWSNMCYYIWNVTKPRSQSNILLGQLVLLNPLHSANLFSEQLVLSRRIRSLVIVLLGLSSYLPRPHLHWSSPSSFLTYTESKTSKSRRSCLVTTTKIWRRNPCTVLSKFLESPFV